MTNISASNNNQSIVPNNKPPKPDVKIFYTPDAEVTISPKNLETAFNIEFGNVALAGAPNTSSLENYANSQRTGTSFINHSNGTDISGPVRRISFNHNNTADVVELTGPTVDRTYYDEGDSKITISGSQYDVSNNVLIIDLDENDTFANSYHDRFDEFDGEHAELLHRIAENRLVNDQWFENQVSMYDTDCDGVTDVIVNYEKPVSCDD